MQIHKICARWLIALAPFTENALAAEVPELPSVEIRGSYDNSVGISDAASQGAVNREIIEKRPLLRPAELFETVPGLIVTQHSGDGKANSVAGIDARALSRCGYCR